LTTRPRIHAGDGDTARVNTSNPAVFDLHHVLKMYAPDMIFL
jgi:hypothetical protein